MHDNYKQCVILFVQLPSVNALLTVQYALWSGAVHCSLWDRGHLAENKGAGLQMEIPQAAAIKIHDAQFTT